MTRSVLSRPTIATFLALAVLAASPAMGQQYDVVIREGRVIDGTGNSWFRADIGIRGGPHRRHRRSARTPRATRVVDAAGLYVTPGFIDLHSHADRAMTSEYLEARQAKSLNSQGLTTVVGGADGSNTVWPITEEMAALGEMGHAMNFVPMVGHSTVRREVMGDDYE